MLHPYPEALKALYIYESKMVSRCTIRSCEHVTTEAHTLCPESIQSYCICVGASKAPPVQYLSYSTGRWYLCSLRYLLCTYAYNKLLMAWEDIQHSLPCYNYYIMYVCGSTLELDSHILCVFMVGCSHQ